MKKILVFLLAVLIVIGGCAVEEEEALAQVIINIYDDGDGIINIPPSAETGYIAITANLNEPMYLQVTNRNDGGVGVRVSLDSSAVIFSDGWIGEQITEIASGIFIEYEVEYTLRVRFYDWNMIQNIFDFIDMVSQGQWEDIEQAWIEQEIIATIIFHEGGGIACTIIIDQPLIQDFDAIVN